MVNFFYPSSRKIKYQDFYFGYKLNKLKNLHFYIDFLNHIFDTEDQKNDISELFRLSE